MVYIGVIVVSVFFHFQSCYALNCMECLEVPVPGVCGQVATCQPNSSCLVREYITSSGGVLYASGCISDQKCSYMHQRALSSETQETEFDLDTCVHCCNDHDYCNIEGCGTKVTELNQRGPYCFECSVENDVYGCRNTRACDAGYACYISEASFPGMYTTGCMPKAVCNQKDPLHFTGGAPMLIGKRDNHLFIPLPHCCETDFCNDILQFETNNTMTVDGSWSLWGQWSPCSLSCGYGGHQTRSRSCDNPPPQNGGANCPGNDTETLYCMLTLCPVDGGWSDWGNWSACSKTCGTGGNMTRGRTCDNPTPTHNGLFCQGPHIDVQPCGLISCPVNGGWSEWGAWSACDKTCGSDGKQRRERLCNNPTPQFGGTHCHGRHGHGHTQTQICHLQTCPVNGGWSDWGTWSACDKTCGSDAEQRRERHCNNPPPQFGGATCAGHDAQTSSCNLTMCPDELCHSYGFSMVTVPETGKDLCLKLFKSAVTWHQAKAQCESHSAHLVTVTSQAKDNAIHTFLHGEQIANHEYVWVGVSGTGDHKDGYTWMTGEPLSYSGNLKDMKVHTGHGHGHPLICGVVLWRWRVSQWWAEFCDSNRYEYLCEINV